MSKYCWFLPWLLVKLPCQLVTTTPPITTPLVTTLLVTICNPTAPAVNTLFYCSSLCFIASPLVPTAYPVTTLFYDVSTCSNCLSCPLLVSLYLYFFQLIFLSPVCPVTTRKMLQPCVISRVIVHLVP